MRIALRAVGLLFLLATVLVLCFDLADGGVSFEPLGALWYSLNAGSLNLVQAVIERYIWEPLWDPVLIAVLQWPAAPTFGVLGALLTGVSFVRRQARADGGGDKPAAPRAGAAPRS